MAKTDKFPRLLNLVMLLLNANSPISLDEIARRIGGFPDSQGARRQAFERAKKELRDLGIPIETRQIPGSEQYGYLIDKSEMVIPDLHLSPSEAASLAAASGMVSFGNAERNSALSKLGCVISGQEATVANIPSQPNLFRLFEAVGSSRTVEFTYRSKRRNLEVYGISFRWGNWYVVGREAQSGLIKTFLVNRIESQVSLSDVSPVGKPSDFRLSSHLPKNRWEVGEGEAEQAAVEISSDTEALIRYELGDQVGIDQLDDGRAIVRLKVLDRAALYDWLLSHLDKMRLVGSEPLAEGFTAYLESYINYDAKKTLVIDQVFESAASIISSEPGAAVSPGAIRQESNSQVLNSERIELKSAGDMYVVLAKILPWLARVGSTTVAEISDTFKISKSQVIRLLEMAACCGVPPYTPDSLLEIIVEEDGTVSSYLDMEIITAPRRLNTLEVMVLATTAAVALEIPGIDPAGHLKSALEKLETSLSNFKLGLAEVDVGIDEPYFLAMLREAANVSKTVEITYFSFSAERITTREVDPYLLFEEAGKWYLRGYCHLAREVRHFSLGRILSCSVTQSTFQLPEDERKWTESGVSPRAFEGTGEWVLLSVPKKFKWLFERLVESPQLLAELEEFEVFGFYASSGRWLSSLLLRLGPEAVVIQPEKYRDLGRLAAAQILQLYKN